MKKVLLNETDYEEIPSSSQNLNLRCCICDDVSTQSHPVRMKWDDYKQGYLCTNCRNAVRDARKEYDEEFNFFMEGYDVLEVFNLATSEGYSGPDRKE